MQRLRIRNSAVTTDVLQNEIQATAEARYLHKLHALLLVAQDWSAYEVAKLFGHSPRTVESYIHAVNESGLEGLREQQRPGRTRRLTTEQAGRLKQDVQRSPREFSYHSSQWDGKLVSHHLKKQFGVRLKVRQCQRLLHALGFSVQRPRKKLIRADAQQQSEFKKNSKD